MASQLRAATTCLAVLLNRRAGVGAIRAVHAAVARQRAQQGMAVRAVVKPLAGIGGHGLAFGKAALGAGEGGFQGDGAHGACSASNCIFHAQFLSIKTIRNQRKHQRHQQQRAHRYKQHLVSAFYSRHGAHLAWCALRSGPPNALACKEQCH